MICNALLSIKKLKSCNNIVKNMPYLATFLKVDSLQEAKQLPCVFNNFCRFYKGQFQTVNLLDVATLEKILKK